MFLEGGSGGKSGLKGVCDESEFALSLYVEASLSLLEESFKKSPSS